MVKDMTKKNPQTENQTSEVEKNYKKFVEIRETGELDEHRGKYALMHKEKIVGIYSTAQDAVQAGESSYEDDAFSIQEITNTPVDLGFYSHAVPIV